MSKEKLEKKVEVKNKPETAKDKVPAGATMVENLTKTWFVQPGSNIHIGRGQTKPMQDDGWLALQVKAGILKKV